MIESETLDVRIDSLYRVVKGRIQWDNLMPTCFELARELEQITELTGLERLNLLQKTLKFAIKDSALDQEKQEDVIHTIDTVVPIIMKAAIMASKFPIKKLKSYWCCR